MTMIKEIKSCPQIVNNLRGFGLIISYEGLTDPIIESQVLEHADELTHNGVRTEVWILCGTSKLYNKSKSRLKVLQPRHLSKIRLFRCVWHNLPLSEYFNAYIVYHYMKKLGVSANWIHARTEYVGSVCAALKCLISFRLILDLRGLTSAEILLFAESKPFLGKIFFKIKNHLWRWRIVEARRKADAAIFVSWELQKMHERQGFNVPYIIIPCVANPSLFYYDQNKRMEMRAKLGYSKNDIIVCYSGSMAAWQCSDETIRMINELIKHSPSVRALILSRSKEEFEMMVDHSLLEKYRFVSAEFDEVNSYLNMADFAIMLRKQHPVNYVASPVKFAEYSMAGLQVITTTSVEQVVEYGSSIGNIIFYEEIMCHRLFVNEGSPRKAVSLAAQKFYSRNGYIDKILSFYEVAQKSIPPR